MKKKRTPNREQPSYWAASVLNQHEVMVPYSGTYSLRGPRMGEMGNITIAYYTKGTVVPLSHTGTVQINWVRETT
jgi:hypothetical protein